MQNLSPDTLRKENATFRLLAILEELGVLQYTGSMDFGTGIYVSLHMVHKFIKRQTKVIT